MEKTMLLIDIARVALDGGNVKIFNRSLELALKSIELELPAYMEQEVNSNLSEDEGNK